jgi:hypothetical protein
MVDATPSPGHKLNDRDWFTLRAIADVVIPPSEHYQVPGGGDENVCKSVLKDVGEKIGRLTDVLDALNVLASEAGAEDFPSMSAVERQRIGEEFQQSHPRLADRLAILLTQCYYRDDRVLESIDVPARAPFPKGYEVEDGDWSKLAAVRARAPFYRAAN